MPKLSQAKRHRRQHNLAAYCCQDSLSKTPRKVSDEDIQNNEGGSSYVASPSLCSLSSSCCSPSDWSVQRPRAFTTTTSTTSKTDMIRRVESSLSRRVPRKRKACLVRAAQSSDLVSSFHQHNLASPSLSCVSSSSYDEEEDEELVESPSFELFLSTGAEMKTRRGWEEETEEDGAMSPIWGHFVDVILEHEDEEEGLASMEAITSSVSDDFTTPVPSSTFLPTFQRGTCGGEGARSPRDYAYSPYTCPYEMPKKLPRREVRHKIISPSLLASVALATSSDGLLPDFVLQDPSTLPDAMARLRVS